MIKFRDLSVNSKSNIYSSYLKSFKKVLNHGQIIIGPEVKLLENKISKICNRKYCLAVSSGTDALILGLRALNLKPKSHIIVPCMSWIATANAIIAAGHLPVFADINDQLNIDIDSLRRVYSPKVKALIYVNFAGKMANIDFINKFAKEKKILVVEDGSQAFGAKYKNIINGQNGTLSAISMNPMKVLGSLGELGVVLTNNKKIYDKMKLLRYNGTKGGGKCYLPGYNYRPDTIQCAIILDNLKIYKLIINKREFNFNYLQKHLKEYVDFLKKNPECKDSHYVLPVYVKKRRALINYLKKKNIETRIHHLPLMPMNKVYKNYKSDIENGKKISKLLLSIPSHEGLSKSNLNKIIKEIKNFYEK